VAYKINTLEDENRERERLAIFHANSRGNFPLTCPETLFTSSNTGDDNRRDSCWVFARSTKYYSSWHDQFSFPNGIPDHMKNLPQEKGLLCEECGEVFRRQKPRGHSEICTKATGSCQVCGYAAYSFLSGHGHQDGCPVADRPGHHIVSPRSITR